MKIKKSDALVIVDALDAYIHNHKLKTGKWRCNLSIKRLSLFLPFKNEP